MSDCSHVTIAGSGNSCALLLHGSDTQLDEYQDTRDSDMILLLIQSLADLSHFGPLYEISLKPLHQDTQFAFCLCEYNISSSHLFICMQQKQKEMMTSSKLYLKLPSLQDAKFTLAWTFQS